GEHHAAQVDPRRVVLVVGLQVDLVDVVGSVGTPVLVVQCGDVEIWGRTSGRTAALVEAFTELRCARTGLPRRCRSRGRSTRGAIVLGDFADLVLGRGLL